MISKILVATDGSETAQKAVEYAIELAKQLKAVVIAHSVIDKRAFITQTVPPDATGTHLAEPIEDYLRKAAEEYAQGIKELSDKNDVDSEISITTGHPVEEIVNEAERLRADLIVLGSHGKSALSAAVLGSITYGVINKRV